MKNRTKSLLITLCLFSIGGNLLQGFALRNARAQTTRPIDQRAIYFDAARGEWIEALNHYRAPRADGVSDLDARYLANELKDDRRHD